MTLEEMEAEIVCSEKSPTPCRVCNCHALREACRQVRQLKRAITPEDEALDIEDYEAICADMNHALNINPGLVKENERAQKLLEEWCEWIESTPDAPFAKTCGFLDGEKK